MSTHGDETLRAAQLGRMRAHVADLAARSPWYKALLSERGVRAEDLRSWEDLLALPTTTKEGLARHNDRFRCVGADRVVDHVSTSGSTGEPVQFVLSEADLQRLARNEARSLSLAGITSADVVQVTTTLDKRFMAGLAYWLGLREIGAGIVRTGPGQALAQWETAQRCGTTALIVVPSFLLRMLGEWERAGLDPGRSTIRKAICIGEPIAAAGGGPNLLARRIGDLCGFALHGTYASTEMATACTERVPFGGHVVPQDLALIEVLDEHGRPVADGAVGEVVATPWGVEAMPLLRFRTGDMCSCRFQRTDDGGAEQVLGPVVGRKEQRMKVKGTTVYPQQVIDALHNEPGPAAFVVLREHDEHGLDVLRVLVDADPGALDEIGERLRGRLGVAPLMEAASRERIEALTHDPGKRKPMLFVDRTTIGPLS